MFEIKTSSKSQTNQQKWESIASLGLHRVKDRFMHKKGGWWNLWHDASQIETEYRQFLYLIVLNPERTVIPWSQDLDDFWHEHILDTRKYAADCNQILGAMIHHNPNLHQGSREHADAFLATRIMYEETFSAEALKKNKYLRDPNQRPFKTPQIFDNNSSDNRDNHGGGFFGGGSHHGGHHGGSHGHGGGHSCGGHGGHSCGGHGCGGH